VGSTLYADRGPPFGPAEFYGNAAGATNFLMAHGDTTGEPLIALDLGHRDPASGHERHSEPATRLQNCGLTDRAIRLHHGFTMFFSLA
jgi:hypothetical protein